MMIMMIVMVVMIRMKVGTQLKYLRMETQGLYKGELFLDAIASPSTYPCQSVGESVSE